MVIGQQMIHSALPTIQRGVRYIYFDQNQIYILLIYPKVDQVLMKIVI